MDSVASLTGMQYEKTPWRRMKYGKRPCMGLHLAKKQWFDQGMDVYQHIEAQTNPNERARLL